MFQVTLKDGSQRSFDAPLTGLALATSISPRLGKEAVAIRVNGDLWDLTRTLPSNSTIDIITKDQEEGLEVLRHDAAHVFAAAIKELFPETQITIGPAIENGFYYDVFREKPFTTEDFKTIEDRMTQIVNRDDAFVR